MRKAKILLEMLTERFPPGPGQHHSITLGNGDKPLQVTLFMGDEFVPLGLEEYDLDCTPIEVVRECERVVESMEHKHKELRKA